MKLIGSVLLSVVLLPSLALADNVGGCGWGSKLFDGQKGVAPQVLAVTTNGSTGNQTFGITSGTSGCTQDGTVATKWKTAAYVGENMNKLALDMSRGEGESLRSLASLMGVTGQDSAQFNSALKGNFAQIFTNSDVKSEQVLQNIKSVLAANETLAKYSTSI
jgi:Protein of unknown function (DUF3015)